MRLVLYYVILSLVLFPFQKDMATQQPNTDTLNKVAKKHKPASPHANPQTVAETLAAFV